MRGKGIADDEARAAVGITPACAGKSRRLSHCRSQFWDHPRVCGEKLSLSTRPRAKSGSPPRVRGKVHISTGQVGGVGITPAYAGKRAVANFRPGTIRDHPRVCGEKGCCKFSSRNHSGSPPRMRGKDLSDNELQVLDGITPAYAGKSVIRISDGCLRRDHPRVCGEKAHLRKMSCLLLGSPPRVRGKGRCHHPVIFVDRITPACAGKSLRPDNNPSTSWDHPRACGEKRRTTIQRVRQEGSPPRMRGKAVPLRSAAASGCRGPSVPEYDAPP